MTRQPSLFKAPPAFAPEIAAGADLSDDGLYRYRLWRKWAPGARMVFCMLNPSTADAHQDDPTIRRCIGFAKEHGCGALDVVNLFALRSTDPAALFDHPDPIGPANDDAIAAAAKGAAVVVVAWGAEGGLRHRDQEVLDLLDRFAEAPPVCLGRTKAGFPRHPLYVAKATPLSDYEPNAPARQSAIAGVDYPDDSAAGCDEE